MITLGGWVSPVVEFGASRLKLPDCCVLDTALVSAAALATFDAALATAARQLNVAVLQ
jgi:hypothetical protein